MFFLSYVNRLWICPRLCLSSSQSVSFQFSLVHSVVSDSSGPHKIQHTRLPCPSPTPRLTQTQVHWFSDAIQPSHPLSSPSPCLQSFPASGAFPIGQVFASGGQSITVSVSTSVLLMNIQDWLPLGLTGWISLQWLAQWVCFTHANVLSNYVNEIMGLLRKLPFFKIHVNHFMAQDNSPCASVISKCMLWVRGLVPVSEFWDISFL